MTEAQFVLLIRLMKLILKGIGFILITLKDKKTMSESAEICYNAFKNEVDKL